MGLLFRLKSCFGWQSQTPAKTIGFLARLQEIAALPALGLGELKALDALENMLAQTPDAHHQRFAVAAFLLDETGVRKAIAAGLLDAPESWIPAARRSQTDSHWHPNRYPHIPPNVVRSMLAAEQVRRYWLVSDGVVRRSQAAVSMLRAIAQEWASSAPPVPPTLGSLIHELEQIKPAEAPEPPAADWFISVSIDVAGSTEAKTREPNRKLDHRATEVFLRAFYAAFLKCELEFYDCLTNSNDNFEPLALSTIFYVKGIGDEVWLLIKPAVANDDHLRHLFVKIVAAALVLASKPISLREAADLPLKIFADKVDGAYSISEQRAEMIKNWLQKMEQENRLEASSFAIIANRLGAGTSTVSAGTWRNAYRTDYIGHDIDRLFRAAKTARPLIVTVGQNFMHAVDPEVAQLPQDHNYHRSVLARIDPLNPNAQRSTSFHLRPECIPARDMKGIEYDYRVYHIHDPAVLRRMVGIPVTRLIQPGFRPVHAERVELRQLMQKSFLGRQRRPFCRRSEELAGEAEDSSPSGSVADP